MSTRVTASVTISAACQQMLRERLNLRNDAAVDLSTLSEIMTGGRIELPSLQNLISTAPITATLATLAPEAFERSRAMLTSPASAMDSRALAASVQAGLADALATASAAITATTRDITADAFAEAGAELGYAVSVCRGAVATGIELRRGHEILLLRVDNGGTVESDQAGLVDATCGDRQRELERAATKRGITLTDRDQQDHGTAEGGKLIKMAAARRDPSLARATALAAEQPSPAEPRRSRSALAGKYEERKRVRRSGGAR